MKKQNMILFYAFNIYDRNEEEILKCKLFYRSLLVNIIMRNMYELCFLFLALTLDKDMCLITHEIMKLSNSIATYGEEVM